METETEPPLGHLGRGRMSRTTARAIIKAHSTRIRVLLVFCIWVISWKKLQKNAAWIKPYNAHFVFLRWHYPDQVMGFGYHAIRSQPRVRSTPIIRFPATFHCVFIIPTRPQKSRAAALLRKKTHIFGNHDKMFSFSWLNSGESIWCFSLFLKWGSIRSRLYLWRQR